MDCKFCVVCSKILQVRYGSHNRSCSEIMNDDIEKVIVHPRFEWKKSQLNNIALIKVNSDIEFIPTVVQAAILPMKEIADGDMVHAVGWEKIDESNQSDTPEILKYHQTNVSEFESCGRYLPHLDNFEAKDQILCTCATTDDTFPELDNGSALISSDKDELIGIAAWRNGEHPNVYVKIRTLLPWIRSVIFE
ncbi:trypsin 3A1-like [Contarinia nasturtii]|uniref:trypsin 3A1-like n=1 Tax=Contarinia nasturtii TaxID=265458 RepID=UPI0012D3AAD3|nr:trypsin 3A1-like [Contarinia nasturtii]